MKISTRRLEQQWQISSPSAESHSSQDLAGVFPVEAKANATRSEVLPHRISLHTGGCAALLFTEEGEGLELPPPSTSSSDVSL